MKTLVNLDDFNNNKIREAWGDFYESNKPKLNGVACPACGAEMYDSNPLLILTSIPPRKLIHCDCGYEGYRYC